MNFWSVISAVLACLASIVASTAGEYTSRQHVAPVIYAGNPRYFNTRHRSYVMPRRASFGAYRTPTSRPVTSTQHQKSVVGRIASKQRGSSNPGSRSSKRKLISNTFRKFERNGNVSDVVRRLERMFRYIPSMQDTVNSMRSQINKNNKRSKQQHTRLVKDMFSIRNQLRETTNQCKSYSRVMDVNTKKIDRVNTDYKNYRKSALNKTAHIENHQRIQDLRHFRVSDIASNNSKDISQLKSSAQLFQELFNLADEEDNNEIVDQKARKEIANLKLEMENQEHEQTHSLENLESELENVRSQQSQSLRLERFEQRLVQQTRSINNIQTAVNMQARKLEQLNELAASNSKLQSNGDDNWFRQDDELNIGHQTGQPHTTNTIKSNHGIVNLTEAVEHNWAKNIEQDSNILENQQHILDLNDAVISHQEEAINSSDVSHNSSHTHAVHQQGSRFHGLAGARDWRKRLEGTGFDDRLDRMSRSLRYHRTKLNNVTSLIDSITDDISSLSITTSNYFNIINDQAKQIYRQNETIVELTDLVSDHEQVIRSMAAGMEYQQVTLMKLMAIVTNLGKFVREPIPNYKDCHDLWANGHRKSGVYSVVYDMQPLLLSCNMTENGGWTVIQRRTDGTQDFDLERFDYLDGFGDVYGEFWLGLDLIKRLTSFRMYTLKFLMEDWNGKVTHATYEQFFVYGEDYLLSVSGYTGDSSDTLSASNGKSFKIRTTDRDQSITVHSGCAETRQSGWWFPRDCGVANPNGPYPVSRSAIFDAPAARYLSVYWMSWRGKQHPLKTISMQVMPQDALLEKDDTERSVDVVEPSPEDEEVDEEYLDNYERGEEYNYRQISVHGTK